MDTETRTAIREAYLFVFDSFAVGSPMELVDAEIANNARHSRELLAILTNANLLVVTDVNGDGDVWQAAHTYDDHTREQAVAEIDGWLSQYDMDATVVPNPTKKASKPVPTKAATPTTTPTKPTEFKHCLCGCGENIPPKANFRPGHDARMAGNLAKEWVTLGGIDDEMLQTLPTEKLRDKAMAIYDRRVAKANAKTTKATEPVPPTPPAPAPVAKKATPRKRAAKKVTAKA